VETNHAGANERRFAMRVCPQCSRPVVGEYYHREREPHSEAVEGTIWHEYYGCDSGCCGHRVTLFDAHGREVTSNFQFLHSNGVDKAEWAQEMVNGAAGFPVMLRDGWDVNDD